MARKALLGNVTDSDLRLLRVFRAVVACGGFAAAELELNINRSTISRHIKDLETRLGVTLCRRGRGGFALTPEGEGQDLREEERKERRRATPYDEEKRPHQPWRARSGSFGVSPKGPLAMAPLGPLTLRPRSLPLAWGAPGRPLAAAPTAPFE